MKTILNIICSKKLKYSIILLFLFCIYFYIFANSYVSAISASLENSVFRLHVLANSDSVEDQNLKYKVRDNLISYMNSISENVESKKSVELLMENHLSDFKRIAQNSIYENGFNYDVNVELGNFLFPTKSYGDISFPAGYYDALRVKIGQANGQNWWCVMFPPLCFVDVSSGIVPEESKDLLENELSEEEYSIISKDDSPSVSFKFKIIELLQNSSILTAKK